ncbi:MAG TPA: hypothetical protein VIK76_03875 [Pyrinomonadaceae bacterium]|jgi:hypothetical protein
MADDRMKNKDLDKNMGGAGQKDQGNLGQQTPGRNKQDDEFSTGQRGAGQGGEQGHMKDDFGTSEKSGTGQSGGQNRQNR